MGHAEDRLGRAEDVVVAGGDDLLQLLAGSDVPLQLCLRDFIGRLVLQQRALQNSVQLRQGDPPIIRTPRAAKALPDSILNDVDDAVPDAAVQRVFDICGWGLMGGGRVP